MNVFVSLSVLAFLIVSAGSAGLLGIGRTKMDLAELTVGKRSLGRVFLWLLMAGENYTSYTFLGAAGWAYSKGIRAFYVFCSFTIACVISYFILPPMWKKARDFNLLTNADYLQNCYASRWLGAFSALLGIVALIPFITLQLTGIQILVHIASYGRVNATVAACCAFFLIVGFVFIRGIRGVAWTSLVKDLLMIVALLFAGIMIPMRFFGSPAGAIRAVLHEHPNWMTLPRGSGEDSLSWFITTVILTACGAFMWPHVVAASYCAKSEDAIRWNAIRLPFYQLMLLLVYIAGFSAIILRPGLTGASVDQSFMLVVQDHYPGWLLGFVAGTGCLAALIAAGSQVLAAASLISRNIIKPLLGEMEEDRQRKATRGMIVFVAALAMGLWLSVNTTIIGLVLMGYSVITQLLPGVMFSFLARHPRASSVGAGISVSLAVLIGFSIIHRNVWLGFNTGLIALIANTAVVLLIEWILLRLNCLPAWREHGRRPFTDTSRGASAPARPGSGSYDRGGGRRILSFSGECAQSVSLCRFLGIFRRADFPIIQ